MKSKLKLSICIPTYNRPIHLDNCLNAILIAKKNSKSKNFFEVCVSDNGSKHNIKKIVKKYKNELNIKFYRYQRNFGITKNFLNSVNMAKGEFVWTIGNDDLLTTDAIQKVCNLLRDNPKVDYYFINSYNLNNKFLKKFSHPFNTKNFPKKMTRFSKKSNSEKLYFWELIDPDISFDFLLGMFFSLFRRKLWNDNLKYLNMKKAYDKRWMSTFENTCFNTIIFGNAFKNSRAYFQAKPLTVNLYGVREWSRLYDFITIVRIPEILDYYRFCGMPLLRYLNCKNFALRDFSISIGKIFLLKDVQGYQYLNLYKHIFKNLIFPNVYLSLIKYILKKMIKLIR